MCWIEPLPGDVFYGSNKAAQARQGKPRQHEPGVQMTCRESGWCLAEGVANKLRDRGVQLCWSCPLACHSQPCHGCANFILAGIWLQGRLAPFPAPNRIFINPFMVKKIAQGCKGAPSHTSKFLSLSNSRVPQFLNFHLHIYSTKHICGKKI